MCAAEDTDGDYVDVFLERGLGDHLGGLTDAGVDDLHSRVPKGSGDHLCTSVVSVEARLGYQDPDVLIPTCVIARYPRRKSYDCTVSLSTSSIRTPRVDLG